MSPWSILIRQATTDVRQQSVDEVRGARKKRPAETHCRFCGCAVVPAKHAYTQAFCNVDCKKSYNRAAYAAKKLSRILPFTGVVGATGVREGTDKGEMK